jgi:hypothetical protein
MAQVRTTRHLENCLQNNWSAVNSLFRASATPERFWKKSCRCRGCNPD